MVSLDNNRVYHGRQSFVEIDDASNVTIDGDTTIESAMGQDDYFTARLMDITITDPEASVTLNDTFGGQIMVEEPSDLVEVEFTMRFQDVETFEEMHGTLDEVGTDTGTYRIQGTQAPGSRTLKTIRFSADNDGDQIDYLMNNALFIQMGEISQEADGFAEISATAVCRIKDRYVEQNMDPSA